jgi:hypothetical protein
MNGSQCLSTVFSTLYKSEVPPDPIGRIVQLLMSGTLRPATFQEACNAVGAGPGSLKESLVDLVLQFTRVCISDHLLTAEENSSIQWLKGVFKIREGDFYRLRRDEVQEILVAEIRRILDDNRVDPVESLHQVDLQRAFGLSYDQWLELTRGPVDEIVNGLVENIADDNVATSDERETFVRRLFALDTVYKLTPSQRRLLDG